MAPTRDFKQTILARVQADPKFRDALLTEGIETMLSGDVDAGKGILRDFYQGDGRLRATGRRDRVIAEEPDPHVRPRRQPAGAQPFQCHQPPTAPRWSDPTRNCAATVSAERPP